MTPREDVSESTRTSTLLPGLSFNKDKPHNSIFKADDGVLPKKLNVQMKSFSD